MPFGVFGVFSGFWVWLGSLGTYLGCFGVPLGSCGGAAFVVFLGYVDWCAFEFGLFPLGCLVCSCFMFFANLVIIMAD